MILAMLKMRGTQPSFHYQRKRGNLSVPDMKSLPFPILPAAWLGPCHEGTTGRMDSELQFLPCSAPSRQHGPRAAPAGTILCAIPRIPPELLFSIKGWAGDPSLLQHQEEKGAIASPHSVISVSPVRAPQRLCYLCKSS